MMSQRNDTVDFHEYDVVCCMCGEENVYLSLQNAYDYGWFSHDCVQYCPAHAQDAIDKMENEVRLSCHGCSDYADWDTRKDEPLGWYKANDSKWYCKCCAEYPYAIDNNIILVKSHL